MSVILKITDTKQSVYNSMLVETFIYWAGNHSENREHLQLIINSKSIRKWFFMEFTKLENEFLFFVNRHPNANKQDNKHLYLRIISRIYELYPSALLGLINKKTSSYIYSLN